jgi:SAM-dependent methyltransferase
LGFYAEWILPALIDLSMRNKRLRPYRERTAGAAEGRVLDIGIGSGLNLPFYAQKAREVFGLDPSLPLLARAQSKAPRAQTPVHLLEGSAERIPLADHSMDTIVMTWTGCRIPEICLLAGTRTAGTTRERQPSVRQQRKLSRWPSLGPAVRVLIDNPLDVIEQKLPRSARRHGASRISGKQTLSDLICITRIGDPQSATDQMIDQQLPLTLFEQY